MAKWKGVLTRRIANLARLNYCPIRSTIDTTPPYTDTIMPHLLIKNPT